MYHKFFTISANNANCNQPLINKRLSCERPFTCTDDENPPVEKGGMFCNFENRFTVITKAFQVPLLV